MRRARGTGRGLGKLILCGEHAVVYGYPALAFAVDRGTEVVLERDDGALSVDAPGIADPRLLPALRSVLAEGTRVRIRSDLPVGRGMGSSAALAVALVRARRALDGRDDPDPDAVFAEALPVERVFHGNPSGLDVAVAARGGFLRYRRGPPAEIAPIRCAPRWQVAVLDTGIAGDTAALVAGVAARRPGVDGTLARIGALVDTLGTCLEDPRALGEGLNENHVLLRELGVSSPDVERLVALARGAGALGAKLSGAGGGGVVIALVEDPAPVLAAAERAGVPAFACGVGGT